MTVGMVPGASIAGMVFSLVVSFALPIGLFVYAKKKLGAKVAPFLIGCGVFFVMVLVRAYLFHFVIDSLSVLLSAVTSVWVVELVTALVTGGAVLMARYACMEE